MSFDLLDIVLPAEGRYCVIGIGRYPDQRFANTREEAEEIVQEFVNSKIDAYYGCAKFGDLNNRTHENALYFRSLWLDIDCGPKKAVPNEKGKIEGYIDQQTGLTELLKFCKAVGLHRPLLVNSGYGIHAYWLLEETVSRREWEPLAERLKELCQEQGLIVDDRVFEASRVLRPLNSFNFKREGDPQPVVMINEDCPRMSYNDMKVLLGAPEPQEEKPEFIPRAMSPLMESLMGNKVKRFKTIMLKAENGCAQLNHCFTNQGAVDEPLWVSALSIAAFCVDGDAAAHKMSSDHPEYDAFKVDQKLSYIRRNGGPHHCNTFESRNPNGCDGCPHKGKIKSPIVLGIEIEAADDCDVEVQDGAETVTVHIPEYPFPFFRGKVGGVYRRASDDEGEPVVVYENDLYVVKRMIDPEAGEVALFRLHLPRDGIKEFTIPLTVTSVKEELRKALAKQGVALFTNQLNDMLVYVTTFIKNLQVVRKAEIMRNQFGWVDGDSKFVLGDREITKDGTFYSPPSSMTKDVADHIHPKGDFDKWKEVFNMYALPGLEPHAFAALTAFGSPLLKFTGMSGAIINVIHHSSGSGKSTALYMCNSIVGHPKNLASIWKDTLNAKMHRLGVMNNLANTIDEITNTSPMEFSDLSYSISQGRGKNRMKASTNEMRVNLTSWNGITLASSNASFYQKLGAAKNTPDGESMRLLEYEIKPNSIIDVQLGKQMFDHQLFENYGHAGEIYFKYLVDNLEDVKALIKKIQAKIDKDVQFTSRERFWSAVAACNIAGGLISKNLGLHDYDMRAVYAWLVGMLGEMREDVKPPVDTPLTILGDFLNGHINNAVVVNGEVDARSNMVALPMLEPRGELLVRYEPDTKGLWIAAKAFKDHCVSQQINYKDALKQLGDLGVFKETANKRMSKGMKLATPAVRALHFDVSQTDSLQLDAMIANENRDGDVQD